MTDTAKSPRDSETTITELMIPSYANFGGKIHGGILLGLMDKVAYACAAKHTRGYCVTVSVDDVDFLQPVEVGEIVSLYGRVNYVGKTSLVVGIRVESENVKSGLKKHTNTCYFTMVAKDEKNIPTIVPELILESNNDVRRFIEAIVRKYNKKYFKSEMENVRENFNLKKEIKKLDQERCQVKISD